MKQLIADKLTKISQKIAKENHLLTETPIIITTTKNKNHGDLTTNLAMILAKKIKKSPQKIAIEIINSFGNFDDLEKIEFANPGFINFFIKNQNNNVIKKVLEQKAQYGKHYFGNNTKVLVEFVSANPTGPLHVGHGRGAIYGDTIARILKNSGYDVVTEYYINDAGRQIDILTICLWVRYSQLIKGETQVDLPKGGYQGNYMIGIATKIKEKYGNIFILDNYQEFQQIFKLNLGKDEELDKLIKYLKTKLNKDYYETIKKYATNEILSIIKKDLELLNIEQDSWFAESILYNSDNNQVDGAINKLKKLGNVYEKDGAIWLNTSQFGDDKDRVLKKSNGNFTYFASDVAYHYNKFNRGYEVLIDVLGADHHGYISRVKASIEALGNNPENFKVALVQFANLYKGNKKLSMSTRAGTFVDLTQLTKDVGSETTRFFYLTKKIEQHLDFDLEKAKSESKNNPIYYIQYASARINALKNKALTRYSNLTFELADNYNLTEKEQDILHLLKLYPEVTKKATDNIEPFFIVNYLQNLVNNFHNYYSNSIIISDDYQLTQAKITICEAIRIVIVNSLNLLGIKAVEKM